MASWAGSARMARTTRWGACFTLSLAALSLLPALRAGALPRYSARYEQNCSLCHVNPSGGGMRSGYATQQLIPKEIAMSPEDSAGERPGAAVTAAATAEPTSWPKRG